MREISHLFTAGVRPKVRNKFFLIFCTLFITTLTYGCGGDDPAKIPAGALQASESKIAFGTVTAGVESNKKTITIKNTATVDVTGISYGLDKGQTNIFLVGSSCVSKLAAGAQCQVEVVVKPDQKNMLFTETYSIKYKVEDNKEETLRLNLSANTLNNSGVEVGDFNLLIAGADQGSTDGNVTVTFPQTSFGTVSDTKTLTLTYNGQTSVVLSVSNPMVSSMPSSSFRSVTDCINLNAGEKCSIFTQFAPINEGDVTADVTIVGTVNNKANQISFKMLGNGVAPAGDSLLQSITITDKALSSIEETRYENIKVGEFKENILILTNNSADAFLYRLSSTIPSISLLYGSKASDCNGRLEAGKSCEFYSYYAPSSVGNDIGYLRVIRGSKSRYIKAIGSSTTSETPHGDISLSTESVKFPRTEIGFESEPRVVRISNKSTTASTGKLRISIPNDRNAFSYTTTCINDASIVAGGSCVINLFFVPKAVGASIVSSLSIDEVGKATYAVALEGNAIAVIPNDNSTDVENLTVSVKRINFPNTSVGYFSSASVFKVSNIGATDIIGFTHTSTDLIRFAPELQLTTCSSIIKAGETCDVAYKFRSTQAIAFKEYIKIAADSGNNKADIAAATELIELTSRGILTNKNIFFGYVDNVMKTKDITYGIVNETVSRRNISKIELEAVRWEWTARDNNSIANKPADVSIETWMETKWFPRCSTFQSVTNCTGTAVNFSGFFTRNVVTPSPFTMLTDSCSGQSIDSGGSCSIKIRYDSTKNTSGKPLSVYAKVFDGENNIVDTLHGIASSQDNTTYFFPPEGEEKPVSLNVQGVFANNESIFTVGGSTYKDPAEDDKDGVYGYRRDRYARKYDTARNIWSKYNNYEGKDWIDLQYNGNDGVQATQERSVVFNGKVYIYGSSGTIVEFDPTPVGTKVGTWKQIGSKIGANRSMVGLGAYNNSLYLFSGRNGVNVADNRLARDIWRIDLATGKWEMIAREPDLDKDTDTFPEARDTSRVAFVDNKLFLYSGFGFDSRYTQANQGDRFILDNLFVFEAPKTNSEGVITNPTTKDKWTRWIKGSTVRTTPPEDPAIDILRPYPNGASFIGTVANKYLLVRSGGATKRYFIYDTSSEGEVGGKSTWNGWKMIPNLGIDLPGRTSNVVVDNVIWIYAINVMGVQFSSELENLLKQQ